MISNDIFKGKTINLFAPNSNEYLYDYIYLLEYKDEDANNWKSRLVILSVLKYLLKLKIIYIYSWCDENLNDENRSIDEIISQINIKWKKNTIFPDYYNIVMFGTQNWYIEKLTKLGMTNTTNWETFVKDNIGNLEKWIEENRPEK